MGYALDITLYISLRISFHPYYGVQYIQLMGTFLFWRGGGGGRVKTQTIIYIKIWARGGGGVGEGEGG